MTRLAGVTFITVIHAFISASVSNSRSNNAAQHELFMRKQECALGVSVQQK